MRYFFTVFNRGFNEAINKGAVDQKLTAALISERSFSYFREGNRERHDFPSSIGKASSTAAI